MKILVVGGAGYIGSHMVRELLDAGVEPIVFDNLSSGHKWVVPSEIFEFGDLGNREQLNRLFSVYRFDAVLHFASFIQVGESMEAPLKYYENNVGSTINLLAAMQKAGVRKFIFSSTAAVYGKPEVIPVSEDSQLNPKNPYGRSKLMVEQILADCAQAWGLKYAILRYFNAAGAHPDFDIGEAHDPETHLIPLILQVALGKKDFAVIHGDNYETPDGTCIRDYVHVCDLASAHGLVLKALNEGKDALIYNLGNGKGYSNAEVLEACRKVTQHPIPVKFGLRRPGDPGVLVADAKKIIKELGWQPKLSDLETIIKSAWRWHKLAQGSKD